MRRLRTLFVALCIFFTSFCGHLSAQPFSWNHLTVPFTTSAPYQGSTMDSTGHVYVAMEYGGIFMSADSGMHWNHSYFEEGYIFELISDAHGCTYAGTPSSGIVRTSDGGKTWQITNNGLPAGIDIYAFGLLNNGMTLLAATVPAGLYSSADQGNSWQLLSDLSTITRYPVSLLQAKSGDVFLGSLDSGLFRSSDGCKTWKRIISFSNTTRIPKIASLPDGTIIVAAENEGVYSSEDNGETWKEILRSRWNSFTSVGTYADSTIICADAVEGVYRSVNRGNEWTNLGFYNVAIRSIVCAPNGDIYVFPAGSVPIVMKRAIGHSFIMPIANLSVICMAAHDSSVFIGAETNVYRISLDGNSGGSQTIGQWATHDLLITRNGLLFAGDYGNGVWKTSRDRMFYSWQSCPTPAQGGYSCFSLAEGRGGVLFAGTGTDYFVSEQGGVYASSDEGATWKEAGKNLPVGSVHKLLVTGRNTLLASVAYRGIYRLKELDTVWSSVKGFPISDVEIKEALARDSAGNIYCGTQGHGIYISTDDGETWTQCVGSNSMRRVTDMLILPNGAVLATTKGGVFVSYDKGVTWESQNSGISSRFTWAAAVDSNGYIYIGTYGAGVFKSVSPITSVESERNINFESYHLEQNYPNPFNPSTTISFTLPSRSFVSLKVFDLMGREVATIVSENLPAGSYERRWTAAGISSGVYFYRLQAGRYAETKRLLLVK